MGIPNLPPHIPLSPSHKPKKKKLYIYTICVERGKREKREKRKKNGDKNDERKERRWKRERERKYLNVYITPPLTPT